MTAPDLTEARDLAAMWQARAEAAEAIAAKLARDVWAAIGFLDAAPLRVVAAQPKTRAA